MRLNKNQIEALNYARKVFTTGKRAAFELSFEGTMFFGLCSVFQEAVTGTDYYHLKALLPRTKRGAYCWTLTRTGDRARVRWIDKILGDNNGTVKH